MTDTLSGCGSSCQRAGRRERRLLQDSSGDRAPGGYSATAAEGTGAGGYATTARTPRICRAGVAGQRALSPTGRKQVQVLSPARQA